MVAKMAATTVDRLVAKMAGFGAEWKAEWMAYLTVAL